MKKETTEFDDGVINTVNEFYNKTKSYLYKRNLFPNIVLLSNMIYAKQTSIVHFTHNDSDAVGCDLVLREYVKDNGIKTVFCDTTEAMKNFREVFKDQNFENCENTFLIFSDIGINSDDDLKELANVSKKFKGILFVDHHISNKMMNDEIFDMFLDNVFHLMISEIDGILISAAWLMLLLFDYMSTSDSIMNLVDKRLKYIIYEISNYDTYNFKNRNDIVHTGNENLTSSIIDSITWSKGKTELPNILQNIVLMYYKIISVDHSFINYRSLPVSYQSELHNYTIYKQSEAINFLENVHVVKFNYEIPQLDGLTANIVVATHCPFSNELMEVLYNTPGYADTAIILYVNNMMLSFRSAKDGINVSEYAEYLGGGGHEHAAGAYIKDSKLFFNILKYCIDSPKLSDEGIEEMIKFSKSII